MLGKGLGNLPWRSFSKMSLVLTPYGIFGSSASEKFPCKPVKESISSNMIALEGVSTPEARCTAKP
jgi:hypothetical protein